MTQPDWSTRIVEGVAVHTAGQGPPIVLLHANGGQHRDFDGIRHDLAREWTVHCIDWPGHGASTTDAPATAQSLAMLLPRLLTSLCDEPAVLFGNSVGGYAALLTAQRHPHLVRALVLVNTAGFTPRWAGSVAICRLIGSAFLAPIMMRSLPRLYLRRRTPEVEAIIERSDAASRDNRSVAAFRSIWRSFTSRDLDLRRAAAGVSAPTLLLWGSRDPVLPWLVDGRRARRAMPRAQVVRLACGHQSFAELPEACLSAVAHFLATADAAPGAA